MGSKSYEIEELKGRLMEFQTSIVHNDRLNPQLMMDILQLSCEVLDGIHRLDRELVNFMILSGPTPTPEPKSVYDMSADEYLSLKHKL